MRPPAPTDPPIFPELHRNDSSTPPTAGNAPETAPAAQDLAAGGADLRPYRAPREAPCALLRVDLVETLDTPTQDRAIARWGSFPVVRYAHRWRPADRGTDRGRACVVELHPGADTTAALALFRADVAVAALAVTRDV